MRLDKLADEEIFYFTNINLILDINVAMFHVLANFITANQAAIVSEGFQFESYY